MTREIFKTGMQMFTTAFRECEFEPEILYELLKDIPDAEFVAGIQKLVQTTTELYPGTNIVALIRGKSLEKNFVTSGEAWAEVLSQIHSVGSWGTPRWSSDLVARAVSCLGWDSLCSSENISVERAHFMQVYDQLKHRESEKVWDGTKQIGGGYEPQIKTGGCSTNCRGLRQGV